jgi:preprotein translocase subunit SecE
MPKQTRAQRRARRAEQERQGNGAEARPVQRQMRAATAPSADAPRAAAPQRRGLFSGTRNFISESVAELKKVEWPGQQQLIQGTAVVLIACVIVGTYLWLADLAFKRLVQNVFLGQ